MSMFRIRTALGGSTQGPAVSNLYFGGDDPSDGVAAHSAVADFWNTVRGTMISYSTIVVEGEIAEIDPTTGNIVAVQSVDSVTYAGAAGSTALPAQIQGLIRFRTGVYHDGREVRGRIFIPGPTEDHNDVGRPTSGYKSNLLSGAALLGSSQVVWRRPTSEEAADGAFELVTARSVWDKWASLNSRRD